MAVRRAVLVIADIGGYTHYMQWNRTHLAHAQLTVAGLLESVIDAAKGLKLAKLEGDAAFFWAPDGDAKVVVGDRLSRMRQSFLARRERFKRDIACECASCSQVDNLSIKFVVHQGEVAEQRVKRHVELAGIDVRVSAIWAPTTPTSCSAVGARDRCGMGADPAKRIGAFLTRMRATWTTRAS
jgi:hypothetical protein